MPMSLPSAMAVRGNSAKSSRTAGIVPQDEKRESFTPVEPIEFKMGETHYDAFP